LIRRLFSKPRKQEPEEALPDGLSFQPKQLSYDQVNDQWAKLQHQLKGGPQIERHSPAWYIHGLRAAAVLTGATLLGLLGWWYYQTSTFTKFESGYGQISRVSLPDGSEVVLNGNSSLRYRKAWQPGHVREAWLEGEAYFHVKKQAVPTRFVLHSGEVQVEVLGTEFNVASRRGHTAVVLHSGSVKLLGSTPDKAVYMKPSELVDYSEKQGGFRKKVVRTEKYLAWQQRKIVFDDTPLHEAAQMLQDTYGLSVEVADPEMAARKLTGELQTGDVNVLISALSRLLDADVQRNGNKIVFRSY
jgi:ferric-dicitrate binding protein FerR (iron transport regulator)